MHPNQPAAGTQPPNAMSLYFHDLYTDGIHPDARFPRDRYHQIAARIRAHAPTGLVEIRTAPSPPETSFSSRTMPNMWTDSSPQQ